MPDNYSSSNDEPTMPAGPGPYYSPWRDNQAPGGGQSPYSVPPPSPARSDPYLPPTQPVDYSRRGDQAAVPPTAPGGRGVNRLPTRRARPRRRRGCAIGCIASLVLGILLIVFLFITGQRVLAFGSAISNQSPLSSQTGYMGGSQRINILLLGYGGSGHDGAYLTDSIVIMSLLPQSHHTTLISIPRDLWVQNPANSGNYTKINAVYQVAAGDTNANPIAGGNAIAQKISLITGLQINYWMTINFAGFKDFIDAIGGIDVNVPDAFNACYPKNDDASVDPAWIKIKFDKGLQHMNGARAIEYARAREPVEVCSTSTSINQAELNDFGRSRRQQLIMQSALVKLKQWQTWPSLYNGLGTLQKTLYSNLSLADLGSFALKMDLSDAHRVGLSNANILQDSTASDGEYILQPVNNDWSQIPTYIQKQLYN